ncbi:hypothetical protein IFM89_021891 [Coptis chinensis]|uniref:Uncharacterized protein n=1 Tax=Coptis chinensis TaxID=261450 RepID=A0A835LSE3_9MAGN|nr:hypothetical protein IFM89_021891 [Coptis chinensis]
MFRLKNFGIEQLSKYDKGHLVKEGELVVTFAQLEYGLMIPLNKEVSRVLSVWRIPPIQVSMSLWLVFARARLWRNIRCPSGDELSCSWYGLNAIQKEDGSLMFHVEWAYPEMKFKGLPKGYRNWDKYCFLVRRNWNPYATRVPNRIIGDRPSTTDFDVSSQALEHLRFYFSMDRDENIWDLSWPNEVVRSCHYSEEKCCGHALDVPKCPYGSRRQAPRQQVTMLEARQAGDEQRDNEQRSLVTASPILEARLKTQKRKITDEAANARVEGLKALEVFPKSTASMERRSKRKADKDFNGTRRPETVVANESVEVGVKEITWAEGTPDDGCWLPLVPLNNEGTGSNMLVIKKDFEIIRGQPQSMEIEQKAAAPNGAMDERIFREMTSVSIPVGDITSVEPLALVSAVFLDDEVIEALRPHADIDFSAEMVEEYMHDQLLLPELGSKEYERGRGNLNCVSLGSRGVAKKKEKHAMPGPDADLVLKRARGSEGLRVLEPGWKRCFLREVVAALSCEKEEMVQAIKGKDKECKKAMRELREEKKTLSELTLKLSLPLLEKAQLEAVSKKYVDVISRARDVMNGALQHYTSLYQTCPRKEVCGILLPSAFEDAIEDLGLEDGVGEGAMELGDGYDTSP